MTPRQEAEFALSMIQHVRKEGHVARLPQPFGAAAPGRPALDPQAVLDAIHDLGRNATIAEIALDVQFSPETVGRAINRLITDGVVEVDHSNGRARRFSLKSK